MIRLRTLLQYKFIILGIVALIFSLVYTNFDFTSKYKSDNKVFEGKVIDYKIDGDLVKIDFKGKEKLKVYYKLKTINEKSYFEESLINGQTIIINGDLELPRNQTVPNLFDYKKYLNNNKIYWVLWANEINITTNRINRLTKFKNKIYAYIASVDKTGYISTLIIGDKSIDPNIYDSYIKNGIVHLFAVSGLHVGIITLFLHSILSKLKIPEEIVIVIISFILMFYLFLNNFSPSIFRVVVMYVLYVINKLLELKLKAFEIFIIAFSILILINPFMIKNLGFIYSFTTTMFLLLSKNIINEQKGYLTKALIVSLIAFLSSLPITLYNNYEISILGPFINLLLIPIFTFIIMPLAFVTLVYNDSIILFNYFIEIFNKLSIYLSEMDELILIMGRPSYIWIIIYYLVIMGTLYYLESKKNYIKPLGIFFIILFIQYNLNYLNPFGEVYMIDVGQGDSFLIKYPFNKGNIIIDTGGRYQYKKDEWKQKKSPYDLGKDTLVPFIKSLGIKRIDSMILSHGDYDHVGEYDDLLENFKINHIFLGKAETNDIENNIMTIASTRNITTKFIKSGNIINQNEYKLYILSPDEFMTNENDSSIVIYTMIGKYGWLFTGDISTRVEKHLVNKYSNIDVDVLKISHHGSKTGTSYELLNKYNIKHALISAGFNNIYKHPHDEVISKLKDSNIETYITLRDGSVLYKYFIKRKGKFYFFPPN